MADAKYVFDVILLAYYSQIMSLALTSVALLPTRYAQFRPHSNIF